MVRNSDENKYINECAMWITLYARCTEDRFLSFSLPTVTQGAGGILTFVGTT